MRTSLIWRNTPARSGSVRWPVHGEHHGDDPRVPRPLADGLGWTSSPRRSQGRGMPRAGRLVMELLERGLTPERLLTREAFENGIAAGAATGILPTSSSTCSR